jgi:hypothetical protein
MSRHPLASHPGPAHRPASGDLTQKGRARTATVIVVMT